MLQLAGVLAQCKPFVGMCRLKTFVGGWTTSTRMHETTKRSCLFGCQDSSDELKHYILCSPLWQIACQALEVTDPFHLEERLCLTNASPIRAQLLSLVFALYHSSHSSVRSDPAQSSRFLQHSAAEQARAYRHHIM